MTDGQSLVRQRTLTQDDFHRYASLSGDDNPIHVDPGFAANTRFGRTVAHGLLLGAIVRGLIEELAPGARAVTQELMFPAPTYAGEALTFFVSVEPAGAGNLVAAFRVVQSADDTVTCKGSAVLERVEPA